MTTPLYFNGNDKMQSPDNNNVEPGDSSRSDDDTPNVVRPKERRDKS